MHVLDDRCSSWRLRLNPGKVSMIDEVCWNTIVEILSVIDHSRRPDDRNTADAFGNIHVILFGETAFSKGCVCLAWAYDGMRPLSISHLPEVIGNSCLRRLVMLRSSASVLYTTVGMVLMGTSLPPLPPTTRRDTLTTRVLLNLP